MRTPAQLEDNVRAFFMRPFVYGRANESPVPSNGQLVYSNASERLQTEQYLVGAGAG